MGFSQRRQRPDGALVLPRRSAGQPGAGCLSHLPLPTGHTPRTTSGTPDRGNRCNHPRHPETVPAAARHSAAHAADRLAVRRQAVRPPAAADRDRAVLRPVDTRQAWTGWAAKLETVPALTTQQLKDSRADAILVFLAGTRRHNPELNGADALSSLSLERLDYGLSIHRATGLPIVLSGGSVKGDTQPLADLGADWLQQRAGVTPVALDSASRDTWENARNSRELLEQRGLRRVILVTHAFHMPRALLSTRAAGIDAVAAPFAFFHTPATFRQPGTRLNDWLPQPGGARSQLPGAARDGRAGLVWPDTPLNSQRRPSPGAAPPHFVYAKHVKPLHLPSGCHIFSRGGIGESGPAGKPSDAGSREGLHRTLLFAHRAGCPDSRRRQPLRFAREPHGCADPAARYRQPPGQSRRPAAQAAGPRAEGRKLCRLSLPSAAQAGGWSIPAWSSTPTGSVACSAGPTMTRPFAPSSTWPTSITRNTTV